MRTTPGPETAAPILAAKADAPVLARPVRQGLWVLGVVGLVLSLSAAVSIGAVPIPMGTVWGVIVEKLAPGLVTPEWSAGRAAIVWEIRLPRALLAALVGAGLALVGAVLQSVTRNPLADPHLLGISSGAAFGAILALLHTGMFLGLATVPLLAFIGALGSTLLVLSVASFAQATSADRLVLTGVAVSFIVMALANVLIFLGDPRAAHTVVFWMLGGLGLAQWGHLVWPALILAGAALWFRAVAGALNAMTIGDETASTLGIPVARFRLVCFVVAALVTGVMVAFSGVIGFVGLMIPHIVRLVVGGDNARVLPAAMLAGAIFLVWADIVARTLMRPEDMPIGIVTGLVGGVFFIWLLRRRRHG
ncbi:FecCD family ABC transporter permease [Roseinatronobacter bogoriensis]|uniref:Iron ABC transporter permease n=1 Tax=Roseinatronobacter bogoriensis subsp. barguzinensis TaxID=441209 RepID=A0A2K8KGZ2_9RHOB|nr:MULTISPECIES: iron ABC transporter permease [Rhodobaca]ATX67263.1 iron ABC transporter permease [Rhodobaca barguzinensis]MBB4206815.1 iron complex transport system permease protein [Rhodobaca bogoriensis DSM 18756]TDW41559.1 iron complex transport system permease protein [Rhodobaca barguzinensis]TDY74263.1 iron complex transport system permease protein [Rhodobaca bogoriensis DSM 18756]